ncbi:MAG: hypothetical protein OIF50_06925 [Flavobacteriaceae bacterium]|nr:hypothetical protein [Flavobacteriaceae bacterium]
MQNLHTSEKVFADADGSFRMLVKGGDVLLLYATHIVSKKIRISAIQLEHLPLRIPVEVKINYLKEVVVTKTIQRDTISAKSLGIINKNIPISTKAERKLKDAEGGKWGNIAPWKGPITINLHKLLNHTLARKHLKYKRKVAAVESEILMINRTVKNIDSLFFADELELEPQFWYNFIYYCAQDPNFLQESSNPLTAKYYFLRMKNAYLEERKD